MTDTPKSLSPMQMAFRQAGKSACNRYAELKDMKPVRQNSVVRQNVGQESETGKSSAQVEIRVEHQDVRPRSGELKLDQSKSCRLAVRLSAAEREVVARRAEQAGLSMSKYFRAAILGPDYVAQTDPAKHELLRQLGRELGRQGTNLNQIAHQLNAGSINPHEGDSMLSQLARSLLAAHRAVRLALTEGRQPE